MDWTVFAAVLGCLVGGFVLVVVEVVAEGLIEEEFGDTWGALFRISYIMLVMAAAAGLLAGALL